MFTNYFFIPASRRDMIFKSEKLSGINNRIFDFEDSILKEDIENAVGILDNIEIRDTDWVRIPFEHNVDTSLIEDFTNLGFNNFIIPKFIGQKEANKAIMDILNINENARFIFLIEHPRSYVELKSILKKNHKFIHAVGFGSHDFSLLTGINNDNNLFRQVRLNIAILAKAYNIEAIDVASMNLSDKGSFEEEIRDGYMCGYRSKFILHPFQLETLNNYQFYSLEEISNYRKIYNYYKSEVEGKMALFSYGGKVYEKMHIKQIETILKWGEQFYESDR